MSKELVNDILHKVESLPPFSQVADKALVAERERSLSGEDPDEGQGFHDPKLAKQILQMTNFHSYSFSGHRAGFFESEAFMAGDVLRGVMLAFSLQEFLKTALRNYGLRKGVLWEHSMNCGLSAWMIATKVNYPDPEAAFVGGMMHDIGKIILEEFLPEENEKFVDITSREGLSVVQAEQKILGIDHAEVGAKVAERWDFDAKVVEAIRCHHQPELAKQDPDLTTIVHLADCISVSLNATLSSGGLVSLLAGDLS